MTPFRPPRLPLPSRHCPARPKMRAGASSRARPFRSWWWAAPGRSWRISASSRRGCFPRWRRWAPPSCVSRSPASCRITPSTRWSACSPVSPSRRSRRAEDIFLPLVSIGAPIPGIAYAPLFLLWFGLGNFSTVLLVGFVSAFPIIFNTWTGVKAVKEIWVRSAQAMGADQRRLFVKVILPGALPYILTGLRLGLAQAWRILVGVEMLAAVPWGLGWLIFGAREFLNTDVMLAGIVVIAAIGLALEKLVFARLEKFTVVRWGMMT